MPTSKKRAAEGAPPAPGPTAASHYMYGALGGLGKLCVPLSHTRELADAIVRDYKSFGVPWALTENKPVGCPMRAYFDFDFNFDTEASVRDAEEAWSSVVRMVVIEIARFWPGAPPALFHGLVLASGLRPEMAASNAVVTRYHAGVHLVFPNLRVDVEQNLFLAAAVTARLDNAGLPCGSATSWEQVVDKAVYHETRGLRWAWQVKDKACDACSRVTLTTARCDVCTGLKRVVDRGASMYTPRARIQGGLLVDSAVLIATTLPSVDLMVEASIRGADPDPVPSPGWVLYPDHPPLPILSKKKGGTIAAYSDSFSAKQKSRAGAEEPEVPRTDIRHQIILTSIRKLRTEMANLNISHVTYRPGSRPTYRVLVSGFGSRFCGNKNGSHNKSTIWFQVTPLGIIQRCHCHKVFNGVDCKSYKGKPVPLLPDAVTALFPGMCTGGGSGGAGGPGGACADGGPGTGGPCAGLASSYACTAAQQAAEAEAPCVTNFTRSMGLDGAATGGAYVSIPPREVDVLVQASRHSKYEARMYLARKLKRKREEGDVGGAAAGASDVGDAAAGDALPDLPGCA